MYSSACQRDELSRFSQDRLYIRKLVYQFLRYRSEILQILFLLQVAVNLMELPISKHCSIYVAVIQTERSKSCLLDL